MVFLFSEAASVERLSLAGLILDRLSAPVPSDERDDALSRLTRVFLNKALSKRTGLDGLRRFFELDSASKFLLHLLALLRTSLLRSRALGLGVGDGLGMGVGGRPEDGLAWWLW
eukprot:580922-Amorphochlora_amoeboformis.AAC.1